MANQQALWKKPGLSIGLTLVVVMLIGAGIGALLLTQNHPDQPIAFPHSLHVGLGAQCTYCHSSAPWGSSAGLPTTDKCWGCHQQITKKSPQLDKLAKYAQNNEAIPWIPVAIQPDHIHFNHQAHLSLGIDCETCHGNVAQMQVAEPQNGKNMGWCLGCHKKLAPTQFTRLSDCALCHY